MEQQFKAQVIGTASKILTKNNESGKGSYVLHNCEITEGKLAGKIVAGSRTLVNAQGDQKDHVEVGDEVTLYMTVVSDDRGVKPFFEIQKGSTVAEDSEILNLLGYNAKSQTI